MQCNDTKRQNTIKDNIKHRMTNDKDINSMEDAGVQMRYPRRDQNAKQIGSVCSNSIPQLYASYIKICYFQTGKKLKNFSGKGVIFEFCQTSFRLQHPKPDNETKPVSAVHPRSENPGYARY